MRGLLIAAASIVGTLSCRSSDDGSAAGDLASREAERIEPDRPAAMEPAQPVPPVVASASMTATARLPRPIHGGAIAFGTAGRWWHWDGEEATAFVDGVPSPDPLDGPTLLAAGPVVVAGHPLVMGSRLVTADGPRPLPEPLAHALDEYPGSHGGYELVASAWSGDASRLVVARRLRPSMCCGRERDPAAPSELVQVFDVTTGEHVELPGAPPLAVGRDRLLVGPTLYTLDPLRALDGPQGDGPPAHVAAMDLAGERVAYASLDGTLRVLGTADGRVLAAWTGPEEPSALAFHPELPLLAVAGPQRVELWRVDRDAPRRLAYALLPKAPHDLVFEPGGTRLVATGFVPVLLELQIDPQAPVAPR